MTNVGRVVCCIIAATITACSGGGDGPPTEPTSSVASVEIQGPTLPLFPAETFRLEGLRVGSSGQNLGGGLTWSSSNQSVATVSSSGFLSAVAPGTARIKGESEGKSAEITINVVNLEMLTSGDLLSGGILGYTSAQFGTYDVFSVGSTGVNRLTTNPLNDQFTDWSADGTRMAFVRYGTSGADTRTWTMKSDGTGETEIAPGFQSWSPDFSRRAIIVDGRLIVSRADGTSPVPVSPATFSFIRGSGFSPDGSKIAYAYAAPGEQNSEMYVANVDGTGTPLNVSRTAALSENIAEWSRDGSKLVILNSFPGASAGLAIVNADGTGFRQLTPGGDGASDQNPAWSPDGTRIAFDSNRGPNRGIWIVSANGGLPTPLTPSDMYAEKAQWGPNGTIAFEGSRPSTINQDIWVMTADRARLTRVTTNPAHEFNPMWKP